MKHFLIYFSCFALFTACKPFQEIKVDNVEKFYLNKLTTENIEAELHLNINNPNKSSFSIYPSEFDIIFSGIRLGEAKLNKKVRIKGNSKQTYTFTLSSKLSQLNPLDILQLVNIKNAGKIEVKGNLKVGKAFIRKTFPINYSEKINLWR